MTTPDPKALIERARRQSQQFSQASTTHNVLRAMANALETSLSENAKLRERVEKAEEVCLAAHEFNEKVADVVSWEQHDVLSGLGSDLSSALKAWRQAAEKV